MKRRNKTKYLIALLLLFISMGFAYLTAILSVNGSAFVKGNKWDIHFENINVTKGSVSADTPVIDNATTVRFNVALEYPGEDFYEFTVDAVNDGTIDAMIDTITPTELTEEQAEYIDYKVTYKINNKEIDEGHALKAGDKITYKIRVDYKDKLSESDINNLSLSFSVKYKKADGTEEQVFRYAKFNTGDYVNKKMRSLSGTSTAVNTTNDKIKYIKRTNEIRDYQKKILI